ncbi:MAG: S1 RNA-binding domain-containing protein [Gemmataceae bacterium]|nr:S1 RNA-binding domain-containing protein [Gemmata sp.]MDW8196006.1 S1 RNA-binding domain-containing protein [Gemmataceae bacterium]
MNADNPAAEPTSPPTVPAETAPPPSPATEGPAAVSGPPAAPRVPPRPPLPGRTFGSSTRGLPRSDRPQRRDKPYNPGGAPPQLDSLTFGAMKPNNRELDAQIEAELAEAMRGFDVESTVAQAETVQKPQPLKATSGRRVGVVVGIHGHDVFIEVPGGRTQGVLPLQQFEGRKPAIGESVEFEIDHYDAANGLLILTREGAAQPVQDWSQVTPGLIVEARVTGTNKNKTGLTVEVSGIKGFLPASQLDLYRVDDISSFVNQRLKVMVMEVNPAERNLIVSRRAVLEREKQQKADEFWQNVQEGQIRRGIVRSVKPFGAFVDLGGADGLIPASEFSWQRVNDLSQFVQVGQEVEVLINRLDPATRKISLSMRKLTTNPVEEFAQRVKPGARISGKVTRLTDFGAFVELEPGVEGLIHISELAPQRVRRVRDIVTEGQPVVVEVLSVDPTARRISLSLKRIAQEQLEAEEAAEQAEHEAALRAAEEAMANRPINPNLRGGIGGDIKFNTNNA